MARRKTWLVAPVIAAAVCVACVTYDYHDTAPLVSAVLTGGPAYQMVSSPGNASFVAAAPDANTREIFWPSDSPAVKNAESCATWATETNGDVQQGAALRIRQVPGGWQAVTVTKNMYFGAYWIFNFHVWDSSKSPTFTIIGHVDLPDEFVVSGTITYPPPWYMCARVSGSTLQFKAWRPGQAEPAYGDPHYGGSVRLPAGWDYPGATGWYVAHAPVNNEATFTDLVTRAP